VKRPAKPSARKSSPTKKKAPAAKKKAAKTPIKQRADYGAPIEGFFAKQPAALRPIVDALRALIDAAAPKAEASLKWGMPFYTLQGKPLCAIGAHKAHVNLILAGPEGTFDDPDGLLTGDGKTGRHLKLTSLAELPTAAVRGWLRAAVQAAGQA
jgi:hypothetical protein